MKRQAVFFLITSILVMVIAFIYRDKLSEFESLGLFGIFLINLLGSATIFFPAPAIATVVAGGALYAPLAVALVSAVGSAMGDMVGFVLGNFSKKVVLGKRDTRILAKTEKIFHTYGAVIIFVSALIPNPLFDAIGIIAGMFSYSPLRFFILVLCARFIRDVVLAYLGAAIPL